MCKKASASFAEDGNTQWVFCDDFKVYIVYLVEGQAAGVVAATALTQVRGFLAACTPNRRLLWLRLEPVERSQEWLGL